MGLGRVGGDRRLGCPWRVRRFLPASARRSRLSQRCSSSASMIHNEAEFQQTLEQLERMHSALAKLRVELLPQNPRLFAVMAEGPLDYIRQFHDELEDYRVSLL